MPATTSDAASRSVTATLWLLSLANFAVGMGAFVVIGILSPVAADLGVGKAQAALLLTVYAAVYAISSPLLVALTGRRDRTWALVGDMTRSPVRFERPARPTAAMTQRHQQALPTRGGTVPLRAAWRMACLGWLIAEGVLTVRRRFAGLDEADRHAQVQRWARRVLRVLGVEVRLCGTLAPEARMLVANHVSWLDVMAVHSVVPQARFVSKADVRHWPAVGALVAGAGSLFVDRKRPRLARASMQEITSVMRNGGLVAVFPEGTTSDGHQVLPFRAGLLQAATQAGCAVQPLALSYREGGNPVSDSVPYVDDDSLVQSLWRMCRAGGVIVTLTMLPARNADRGDRRALAALLQDDVVVALGLERATSKHR